MEEEKKTVGDWLFTNIEQNNYLNTLYNNLLTQYTYKLNGYQYYLSDKEIKNLYRFADILSKSTDENRSSFHKNLAQNIVCILEKIYPDHVLSKIFMGSVLTNVNNYVGLSGKCSDYKNPDVVESFVEIITKEAYRIPDECGSNLFFDASQVVAFENIKSQDYYSFSGPTSMGKTFLVKMFIKSLILQGNRYNYVIVVPSKALINEVKSEIIETIGISLQERNYKVITAPTAIMNDRKFNFIMIYTQERLSYQIKLHQNVKINYLFIDEAQKISEVNMRSAHFYKVVNSIVNLNNAVKIYFLCPYIPNPDIYLKLIPGRENKKNKYDIFQFSPVNQYKTIVDISNQEISVYSDLAKQFITKSIKNTVSKSIDYIYDIGSDKSNIIFCDSKKAVEENAIEYWVKCKEDNNSELKELIEEVKKDIHPKSFLVYFLQKGICCHVGYLPSTIKVKIEQLFRKKVIKSIFCTSTLLEGVNLPADNLFIVIKKNSYILKNSADFRNLMGRVGRKTYNLVGNVYVVPESGSSLDTFNRCKELIKNPVDQQKLSIDQILDSKLKNKILNSLVDGTGTIAKGNMSYELFGLTRFIINILIKCILKDDSNNYIYKQFEDVLNLDIIASVKEKFQDKSISDDSNITTDQLIRLDNEIKNNMIYYPEIIDYENVKGFLLRLHDLFQWGIYEKKTNIGNKDKLPYYAVLLNQWMQGHSVKRIIDKSIKHVKGKGEIYSEATRSMVPYEGKNSQDNSIVIESLTAIEDILLFSISNYFTKFSERYKALKKVDIILNDWSEYLDFGTNDKLVIELQKIGFSREVAKIIQNEQYAFLDEKGIVKFCKNIDDEDNEEFLIEMTDVKLNYSELFDQMY